MDKYRFLLVALCFCIILPFISTVLAKGYFDTSLGVACVAIFSQIVWIPVAVWIYKDSKRTLFLPWLWALLLLFSHWYGLTTYLLVQLLSQNKKSNIEG